MRAIRHKRASLASAAMLFIAVPAVAQTAQPATPPGPPATATPGTVTDATGAVGASEPPSGGGQQPASPGPGASQGSGGLEDIVVTATRRTVNLQRVNATVEAVTANTLKAYNITGVL